MESHSSARNTMRSHDHSTHTPSPRGSERQSRRFYWVFGGFATIAVLLLVFEHQSHLSGVLGWLPWLILLACPLMHLFLHRGHSHGGHGDTPGEEQK